ncbi:MAG TPA: GNAT family N-acetyltransferase [Candidatus Binatia bacterium]|nr:GNAT family N-acetyltransferase [Candidatus Binatia bacterium]
MDIRPIQTRDAEPLRSFFDRIPEGDRTFFKEDVLDPQIVPLWTQESRARRSVAVDGAEIVGAIAVIPGLGWSSHVGELRLVVDPARRRQGLGRQLARRGLIDAVRLGLRKIVVEVVADQTPAVAMFQSIGFAPEALLRDYVRDRAGELRDLILLAHSVDDRSSEMATLGIDEAVKSR